MKNRIQNLIVMLVLLAGVWRGAAQGTAFTYQGRLNDGVQPANGIYDFIFQILDVQCNPTNGGTSFGSTYLNGVGVTNGLFTVTLDFGPGVFTGPDRWLETTVRTNGGTYYSLCPRQQLTPTPYAIFANTASNLTGNLPATQLSGSLPSGLLTGAYSGAVTFNNAGDSFAGDGSGLLNVNAGLLGGFSASQFWKLTGNGGTTAGLNFVGTTDNQPLEMHVNGTRALRLEPNGANLPNVIGGAPNNQVTTGMSAATIGGGTGNQVGGQYGTVAGGQANFTSQSDSTVGGGGGNNATNFYATVAGGQFNLAGGDRSVVGGGARNSAVAYVSAVGGGFENSASGTGSFIGGGGDGIGANNLANGNQSVVVGGLHNSALANNSGILGGYSNSIAGTASYAIIGGGIQNSATAYYATVGGGSTNSAGGANSAICGGAYNTASAAGSFIGGGGFDGIHVETLGNTASGLTSVVVGGTENTASGVYSFVGGGDFNRAQSLYGVAVGGENNLASVQSAAVVGGANNTASGLGSFVGGGGTYAEDGNPDGNLASGQNSVVTGGNLNTASGEYSTVAGGYDNDAYNDNATISGGNNNAAAYGGSVAGGYQNFAYGNYSTVAGGLQNEADGVLSFAAGYNAQASYDGDFVWSDDSSSTQFDATGPNQFCIRAVGGIQLQAPQAYANFISGSTANGSVLALVNNTASPTYLGAINFANNSGTPGQIGYYATDNSFHFRVNNASDVMVLKSGGLYVNGTFVSSSDRNAKEHFQQVSPREILQKVAGLPVSRWNYKADAATEHIGPMAQDFYAAFKVGPDDRHITTIDEEGVALAAIQGLNQKVDAKDVEIQTLRHQNDLLAERLSELEAKVNQLGEQK